MTNKDAMTLLKRAVTEADDHEAVEAGKAGGGQAVVARRLGYSGAAISQVLSGKYQGNIDQIMSRVVEVYGNRQVDCPVLGDIPLGKCAEERKKPLAATNPTRAELYKTCQRCGRYKS